ncbi:helix-turn-helix domain-containing protein [Nocardiopsis chromatogenes]|uniref:helix-turn-helix domain-containing protein n=1 Tax=Nocardiopsis chromatogenes TaxID=280239 RepID=UPI000477ACFC|nr:helix-turn-helix transcriptional regulator [Nocardiopsis chromatogenes]
MVRVSFASDLKALREVRGASRDAVARATSLSTSMVAKAERGTRALKRTAVEAADRFLEADGRLLASWESEGRAAALPSWATRAVESEDRAVAVSAFSGLVLPGLLQTPEYARELLQVGNQDMPRERVEAVARSRTSRLEKLRGRDLQCVVFEPVLSNVVGDAAIMRDQLTHLLETTGVRILILPQDVGSPVWAGGAFRLLEFADRPPLAHTEDVVTSRAVTDAGEVRRLARLLATALAWSLNPPESRALIERKRNAYQ